MLAMLLLLPAMISPATPSARSVNTALEALGEPGSFIATAVALQAPHSRRQLANGATLVASREITDPNFRETVIVLIHFGEDGALGVIINRPTRVPVDAVLESTPDGLQGQRHTVYLGGPVGLSSIRVIVRTDQDAAGLHPIIDGLYVLEDAGVLARLLSAPRPPPLRFYAGYAGWAPGQLETEVLRGDWFVIAGDPQMPFTAAPESLWRDLIEALAGHWVLAH
jgi:putative transcriptional regulator